MELESGKLEPGKKSQGIRIMKQGFTGILIHGIGNMKPGKSGDRRESGNESN